MTSRISIEKRDLHLAPLQDAQDFTQNIPSDIASKILSFVSDSDLSTVKLLNRQWRVYAQGEMFFRLEKCLNESLRQIEPFLAVIQPHLLEEGYSKCYDSFVRLQECKKTLKTNSCQNREHIQSLIVATKEVIDQARRTLILSLASSTTAFNPVQEGSLLNTLVNLEGDFKHIIPLARATQWINVDVEHVVIANTRLETFDETLTSYFFNPVHPPLSELVIGDILAVVDPEVHKILMVKLLSTDESLVDRFIKRFSKQDRDYIFQNWTSIMIARGDFDGAKEKIKCIKDECFKSNALKTLVTAFIQCGQTDEALKTLRGVNYLNVKVREQLIREITQSYSFSEEQLRSPEVIAAFLVNIQAAIDKENLPIFYKSFFGSVFVSVENQLDQLKAYIADKLIERGEFGLVMLIATDRTLRNPELSKDVRSKIFQSYLQALPQDSSAKDLAVEGFLNEFPYFKQTEFMVYLIISMLEHGFYENALICLKNCPKGCKVRFYNYEYLQVHLENFIKIYIQQEDYSKVLSLSYYIDRRNDILFYCILNKVDQLQEGAFEERWSRMINECFPELSLEDKNCLEVYKKVHMSRLPLDTKRK